jgi:hypothetical protein
MPTFPLVGTIVSSLLDESKFAKLVGDNPTSKPPKITWVLADGRNVAGTKFASLQRRNTVPDLRGMFLRGIDPSGATDPDGPRLAGSLQTFATALPSVAFVGATSQEPAHNLPNNANASRNDFFDVPGGPVAAVVVAPSQPLPPHHHNVTVNGGGDSETRPKNVAVFYFVKVN